MMSRGISNVHSTVKGSHANLNLDLHADDLQRPVWRKGLGCLKILGLLTVASRSIRGMYVCGYFDSGREAGGDAEEDRRLEG